MLVCGVGVHVVGVVVGRLGLSLRRVLQLYSEEGEEHRTVRRMGSVFPFFLLSPSVCHGDVDFFKIKKVFS